MPSSARAILKRAGISPGESSKTNSGESRVTIQFLPAVPRTHGLNAIDAIDAIDAI
jgi:hypothetical protein